MACYRPLTAWQPFHGSPLKFTGGTPETALKIPCGKCFGCISAHARDWANRCNDEAKLYESNCFVTLTYSDDFLPDNNSVSRRALQLFLKRLRSRIHPQKFRYFACGEYGEKSLRPHYHLLVFGYSPPDLRLHSSGASGLPIYTSALIESCWDSGFNMPFGFCSVGTLTAQSCAYTCRYVLKKLSSPPEFYYAKNLEPPFVLMSRRPGIGRGFLELYQKDLESVGCHIGDSGIASPLPKYYERYIRSSNPRVYSRLKRLKREYIASHDEPDYQRLLDIECAKKLKFRDLTSI